jgi:hypothetical protein
VSFPASEIRASTMLIYIFRLAARDPGSSNSLTGWHCQQYLASDLNKLTNGHPRGGITLQSRLAMLTKIPDLGFGRGPEGKIN